jgi:regulator of sirC expression with transglutaminase-like and TPR domain
MASDAEALPDLLIDRARAYAMEGDWRHSEEDLSRALDLRADDPLALRLRAEARMRQNAMQLALADAERAVTLEPASVDARLVLGNVREARRTGEAPIN